MSDEDVDWEKVYESIFKMGAFSAIKWIWKAVDLYKSAKLFEPEINKIWKCVESNHTDNCGIPPDYYNEVYFMLLSFCVENLLKAALISKCGFLMEKKFERRIVEGKKTVKPFSKSLTTHDLLKLAIICDLSISLEEEDLLRRLSRCATWQGRYPCPLQHLDVAGIAKFSDGKEYSTSWFGSTDIVRLKEFIKSLPSRLNIDLLMCRNMLE